ncbi:sister chromatid cohesion protein-like protein Dcc1 [Delitschia confertaspora ATCC 74209]|uniref:Sister chromatid cohesion protein-like protein Dcc1 n=1 Tax=Delitschia confertaspora ATCC 74209 TaxID=1513339 RepID=A0A9P4JIL8_9PLEO|nr:sister chromatid cohesion protein-like protein Dcc1 [Delitschia confertaspora ATCC 74209]
MATQQDEGGFPLSISHNLRQFRLLELPPDLLELIDSPHPPSLSIKAQAPSAAAATPTAKPAYAVLCTPTRTYQLRQVQTSNSVYITQPDPKRSSQAGISAIASCSATLEPHPVISSAVDFLKDVLPVYDIIDGDVDAAGNGKNRQRIFVDIPLSDGECQTAWTELIAFEFAGSSYRPSANTLFQVWKAVHSAVQVEGIKLDSQFLTDEILTSIESEGFPSSLVSALFQRLGDEKDSKGPWSCLNRQRTVQFVGQTLLEQKTGDHYLVAQFLDLWRDSLPEAWREEAELETIKGSFHFPSSTTIAFGGDAAVASAASEKDTPKAGSSSRKWHEKLGRARQKK